MAVPLWLRGSGPRTAESGSGASSAAHYSSAGRLLSPPVSKGNSVWCVAIGMLDSEPLAVVGRADGTLQLWNPVTGKALGDPLTGHEGPVYSIALRTPTAVSAGTDGTLRVWDLAADPPAGTRLGDRLTRGINSVALGTVNDTIVAVSGGDDRTIRRWNPAAPGLPGEILGERLDAEVRSVALATVNGRTLAVSGSANGTIRLWDVGTGRLVRLLGAHEDEVWAVATGTVRGRTVAVSGGNDGALRSWDLTAPGHPGKVIGERLHSAIKTVAVGTVNGTTVLMSAGGDNTIRLWDLATGRPYGTGLAGPEEASNPSRSATSAAGRSSCPARTTARSGPGSCERPPNPAPSGPAPPAHGARPPAGRRTLRRAGSPHGVPPMAHARHGGRPHVHCMMASTTSWSW
ncbi:WD40 repeat domain-containing protein [Thermocatellispora tengchongensis]|uniref:WD40 repeat domain-containing protein n=1 Tax=Thermocatellispora tengchongensis TaxID=1073253 RepID=UPI00363DE0B7